MITTIFVFSGNYTAGKTYASRLMVGASNTFSMADPLRKQLFTILNDDAVLSRKTEDKNKLVGKARILKAIKEKPKSNKVPTAVFRKFQSLCRREPDLKTVTFRRLLQLYGAAGRAVNRYYWARATLNLMDKLHSSSTVAIDDVRFKAEIETVRKAAEQKGMRCVHFWIGDEADGNYENKELEKMADYKIFRTDSLDKG